VYLSLYKTITAFNGLLCATVVMWSANWASCADKPETAGNPKTVDVCPCSVWYSGGWNSAVRLRLRSTLLHSKQHLV